MPIVKLSAHQFMTYRKKIILFLKQHGEQRITKQALHWMKKATLKDAEEEGFLTLCYLQNKALLGVLIVANYGLKESVVTVHKKYRNQNIAKEMLQNSIHHLGKMYARVALDNIPSLKICFDNDMVAFYLFAGVTKKPTLWLGGGNWQKEDIIKRINQLT